MLSGIVWKLRWNDAGKHEAGVWSDQARVAYRVSTMALLGVQIVAFRYLYTVR
jgi:hypothetical protein